MIYKININTEIILKSVDDLSKLKVLIEVNNLDKPNFSAIARELGSDYIVVGRSITGAEDPVKAYRQCVKEFLG